MNKGIATILLMLLVGISSALAVSLEKAQEQAKQMDAKYVGIYKDDASKYVYNPLKNNDHYMAVAINGYNYDLIASKVYTQKTEVIKIGEKTIVVTDGDRDVNAYHNELLGNGIVTIGLNYDIYKTFIELSPISALFSKNKNWLNLNSAIYDLRQNNNAEEETLAETNTTEEPPVEECTPSDAVSCTDEELILGCVPADAVVCPAE